MFCTHCGKQIADSTKFCGFCGGEQIPLEQNRVTGEDQVRSAPEPAPMQYFQQSQYQQPPVQQPYVPYSGYYAPDGTPLVPAQAQYPLKWFKLLIYFTLFGNALFYLVDGIASLFGLQYIIAGFEPGFVYSMIENLRIVDSVFGVIHLALAAAYVIVRFQLSGFKRNAPKMLYILTGVETVFSILYTVAYSVIGESLLYSAFANFFTEDIASLAGTVLGSAIFLFANISYFNKRKSLFVN